MFHNTVPKCTSPSTTNFLKLRKNIFMFLCIERKENIIFVLRCITYNMHYFMMVYYVQYKSMHRWHSYVTNCQSYILSYMWLSNEQWALSMWKAKRDSDIFFPTRMNLGRVRLDREVSWIVSVAVPFEDHIRVTCCMIIYLLCSYIFFSAIFVVSL